MHTALSFTATAASAASLGVLFCLVVVDVVSGRRS